MRDWWQISAVAQVGHLTGDEWDGLRVRGQAIHLAPTERMLLAEETIILVTAGHLQVSDTEAPVPTCFAHLQRGDLGGIPCRCKAPLLLSSEEGADLLLLTPREWLAFLHTQPRIGIRLVRSQARRLWLAEQQLVEQADGDPLWRDEIAQA